MAQPTGYDSNREQPSIEGFFKVRDGKRYQLVVVQHPNRARMCGFGDKDRRPLSPTLIVKLLITDDSTGSEISPLDVNASLFLLATDLCHPDDLMLAPRNILVHNQPTSNPSSSSRSTDMDYARGMPSSYLPSRRDDSGESGQLPPISSLDLPGAQDYGVSGAAPMFVGGGAFMPGPAESYTRNLVGAAVASASVLKDETDQWGIFFVFQDISVRTEGVYRIKLMFVNLDVNGRVGTGVSEALAETYTDPFRMLDPTPLSRKLASQGIKIPVRNDKKKLKRRTDDDEEDDED